MDKLAQEVTTALAAGMSYGKWKAKQEIVTPVKKELPEGWKYCAYCGEMFEPKPRQKYCEKCRKSAYAERSRKISVMRYAQKRGVTGND